VSPLYPINFILPIISPTVKNPRISAKTIAPEAICALLRLRKEFKGDFGKKADGFLLFLMTCWKAVWNVARGLTGFWLAFLLYYFLDAIFEELDVTYGGAIFCAWKTSLDSSKPTRA
jgi:hypothetical protein